MQLNRHKYSNFYQQALRKNIGRSPIAFANPLKSVFLIFQRLLVQIVACDRYQATAALVLGVLV